MTSGDKFGFLTLRGMPRVSWAAQPQRSYCKKLEGLDKSITVKNKKPNQRI